MPIPVKILWDKLSRNCLTLPYFKMREPPLRLKGGGGVPPCVTMVFSPPRYVSVSSVGWALPTIRIPIPEAYFIHKLIVACRRRTLEKREKDLEDCKRL
jgi:hypothetical protein